MKLSAAAALTLILSALLIHAAPADEAQTSGEAWLSLIDQANYAQSWTAASSYFRDRVPQEKWVEMVRGVRQPLGALSSRRKQSVQMTTTLPGAPDGNYAVFQFQSSFEHKASAVETLILSFEDGQWKAAGYFIR